MTPPDHAILRDRDGRHWVYGPAAWRRVDGDEYRTWIGLVSQYGPIDVFIHRNREDTA